MRPLVLVSIALLLATARLAAEDVLATTTGKFATADGSVAVVLQTPAKDHLKYAATFIKHITVEKVGDVISKKEFSAELPVVAGEWAVCLVEPNTIWVYVGKGAYSRIQYDRGECLTEEIIAAEAPAALKRWVQSKKSGKQE